MESREDIPTAQQLEYAPMSGKRPFPWLMFLCAPVLGAAAFCLVMGTAVRITDQIVFAAFGCGLAVVGGIWFYIAARRR